MISTSWLEEEARKLGFDLAGAAQAGRAPHADAFLEWLHRGYAGEMAYLARTAQVRADPHARFDWARSIVCVAARYPGAGAGGTDGGAGRPEAEARRGAKARHGTPGPGSGAGVPGAGKVSCYAALDDYHDVLGRRLEELARTLAHQGGGRAHPYVDTGPVLEREWASASGLGWIGKNTCLINERFGSWLFLGVIFLEASLEPAPTAPDRCGTCTRCIDACPTGALVAPYLLDARRCISYLTIEHRSPIPLPLREFLDGWVFGCDICQTVCPWNERAAAAAHGTRSLFQPRADLRGLNLEWALRHTAELERRTAGTPLERARGEKLLRNIFLAAGNSGSPRLAELLRTHAVTAPAALREQLSWALRRLAG